jgi:hypothetical protein
MNAPDFEPPIQNLDVFDVLGERHDGGIDAAIVAATPIDGQVETLTALALKVRNYITELCSDSFQSEHPRVPGSAVRIVIVCHGAVDASAYGLISSLRREAEAAGIQLDIEHVV